MQVKATQTFSNYLSLVKFSHTVFALPFAIIGFILASTHSMFSWELFVKVILCMVFARSSAMAFNRYLDKDIDILNDRTKNREIPKGIIKPRAALSFTIANILLFIGTTFFINRMCFYLSPLALLVILGYSYTKRFTSLCHLVLGLGLSLAPIGAYLAVTGKFALLPVIFSFIVLFWVSGFDIIYSLQDEDFDKQQALKSIPVLLGTRRSIGLSVIFHIIAGGLVIMAGFMAGLGTFYWVGASIFIALLIYQHSLVKPNDLSKVNIAFMTTNGVASILFAVFVVLDLYL